MWPGFKVDHPKMVLYKVGESTTINGRLRVSDPYPSHRNTGRVMAPTRYVTVDAKPINRNFTLCRSFSRLHIFFKASRKSTSF